KKGHLAGKEFYFEMCLLRYTWRIKMAAGVIPEMRVACPGLVSSFLHGIITWAKTPSIPGCP
ncbi:MAG: hypothetical protein AMJ45_04260, partial [Syntrophobacter sp. DG_60]